MKGIELSRLRKKHGLTQSDFADLASVTKRTVISWEKKENIPFKVEMLILSVLNDLKNYTSDRMGLYEFLLHIQEEYNLSTIEFLDKSSFSNGMYYDIKNGKKKFLRPKQLKGLKKVFPKIDYDLIKNKSLNKEEASDKEYERIRNKLLEDGITGYRIGKDTPINQVTADNFLNGKSKPYKSTLDIYESYIINGYRPLKKSKIIVDDLYSEEGGVKEYSNKTEYDNLKTDNKNELNRIALEYLANRDEIDKDELVKADFENKFLLRLRIIKTQFGSIDAWLNR